MLDDADALYELALEGFTEARDALAKQLRADKRREDADAVHALRKPSVAAWAINQAVRGHSDEADELFAAGAGLREAHEALLGGGDREEVRAARERERDAVRVLTRHALDALGERASEPTAEKIRATLHAVATDEALREEVQAGRLQHESDGGTSGWPEADPAAEQPAERTERRRSSRASGVSDAERRRVDAGKRAQREAERAQEAEADADAAAENAREVLAEAEVAARSAREKAEEADAAERAARRGSKEAEAQAERRRTEARRAVKAARARS